MSEWCNAAVKAVFRVMDEKGDDITTGQIVDALLAAAEPLIRADERRQVQGEG